jgi:hypothetical protein
MGTRAGDVASLLLVAVAAITLSERSAGACSCVGPAAPPCQAAWSEEAVFTGTVLAIEDASERTDPDIGLNARVVTFMVERAYVGPMNSGDRLEVRTGKWAADCGFAFRAGRRYLVYASKHRGGALATGICSRTRTAEEAAEDLAYLDSMPTSRTGAEVTGRVVVVDADPHGQTTQTPVGGALVDLEGDGGRYSAVTDASGEYRLDGVPPGRYRRTVRGSADLARSGLDGIVEVADARGCARDEVYAAVDRRVTGRVVDSTGDPLRGRLATLLRVGAGDGFEYADSTDTDAGGRFAFVNVRAGRYRVLATDPGVSPYWREARPEARYCPGVAAPEGAAVLTVGPGAGSFDIGECRVPR